MLTSAMRGETLTPNPNGCSSTLTSGTNNIYPYPYIDVNDWGHCFRSGSLLTNYPHASMLGLVSCLCSLLDLMSGSFFGLTSGLPFSPLRLIFKLVPILKLGNDISILLLQFLTLPIFKFISLESMYMNSLIT